MIWQIQLGIDRIHTAPLRMGIGGTGNPDFPKDGHIGRSFGLCSLIFHWLSGFTKRRITSFISCAGQCNKGLQKTAPQALHLTKQMVLNLVKLFAVNRTCDIGFNFIKPVIQAFKQRFFFVDCHHDRAPFVGQT
jgi:hypothetical protein